MKELTNIRAFDVADDGSLFACGDHLMRELFNGNPAEADYSAGFAFMTSEGEITSYASTKSQTLRERFNTQDRCMGITHDKKSNQVVALLQSKNDKVRLDNKDGVNPADNLYSNGFYDTVLVVFTPDGPISQ